MLASLARNRWWALYNELEIRTWAGSIYLPRSTPQSLDDFETLAGFKLPPSYREFVSLFGPGELARWFHILAPVGLTKRYLDLAAYHRWWLKETRRKDFDQYTRDPVRMKRIAFFCDTFGADYFAWDPKDPSEDDPREYRVHLHYRQSDHPPDWEVAADTFEAFVRDYCFTHAPKSQEDDPIRHVFFFDPQELKSKPKREQKRLPAMNCQKWHDAEKSLPEDVSVSPNCLIRNDGVVLKLATQIVVGDHFDLAPLLADAMEEAGGAHDAITSHLRNGGWHLRNCWAFKLLVEASAEL